MPYWVVLSSLLLMMMTFQLKVRVLDRPPRSSVSNILPIALFCISPFVSGSYEKRPTIARILFVAAAFRSSYRLVSALELSTYVNGIDDSRRSFTLCTLLPWIRSMPTYITIDTDR